MVNKSCLRRNASCIAFVGAFGVFLLRCRCFWLPRHILVDVPLWYSNTQVTYYLMKFVVMYVFGCVFLAALIVH
jgi:hypothetical protein